MSKKTSDQVLAETTSKDSPDRTRGNGNQAKKSHRTANDKSPTSASPNDTSAIPASVSSPQSALGVRWPNLVVGLGAPIGRTIPDFWVSVDVTTGLDKAGLNAVRGSLLKRHWKEAGEAAAQASLSAGSVKAHIKRAFELAKDGAGQGVDPPTNSKTFVSNGALLVDFGPDAAWRIAYRKTEEWQCDIDLNIIATWLTQPLEQVIRQIVSALGVDEDDAKLIADWIRQSA